MSSSNLSKPSGALRSAAVLAFLAAAFGCRDEAPPPPAPDGVVVRVEGEPITLEEIDALSSFLALCFPNHAMDTLRQNALHRSLYPRAFARGRHPEREAAAREKIERAKARLEAGEPFEQVAREMSEQAAEKGGDLGWLAIGDLDPLLGVEALDAGLGEVRGPIRTRLGWHLLQVTERHADPRAWHTAIRLHQIVARIGPDDEFDRRLLETLQEEVVVEPVDRALFERIRPVGLPVRVAQRREGEKP